MRGYLLLAALLIALVVLWLRWPTDPAHEPEALSSIEAPTSQDAIARTAVDELPVENASQRTALPVVLEQAAGIVLEGRVIELAAGADRALGTPAVGATVIAGVESLGGLGSEDARSSATTDADGSFRIVLADDGNRPLSLELFIAADERFRSVSTRCRLEQGESRRTELLLTRFEHGALAGRTIDVLGRPVPSVEIVLLTSDEEGESLNVPVATTISDESGVFVFADAREFEQIGVNKDGYTLLEAIRPQQDAGGSWEPMEIVLCGEGSLRVRVIDPAGEPVSGVQVWAWIAQPERFGGSRLWNSMRESRRGTTDRSGTAVVHGVWADQRLRISLLWSASGRLEDLFSVAEFERVENGKLLPAADGGGEPLFLASGTEREVHTELAGRFRIFGRVLNVDGSRLAESWVSVTSLDRPPFTRGFFRYVCRGDADGRFDLQRLSDRPMGRVLVTATEARAPWVFGVGIPSLATWRVLDPTGRASVEEELVLTVEPTLAIAGRIVSDPPGIGALVEVHPLANELSFGALATGTGTNPYGHSRESGEFRIAGLPPGRYDVEVSPTSRFPTVWVRDVEAGSEDLTISLEGTRPARVTVEVMVSDDEFEEALLLTGRVRSHGERPEAPELPKLATYRTPSGWPPSGSQLWHGSAWHTDELGTMNSSPVPLRENPTTVELDEGLYWIGARTRAKDGNLSFPIGTGLVHVSAGEHHLRFELTPTASIEGRVIGGVPGRELFVALARDGQLLTLDVGRNEMRPLAELGIDGFFRFPLVPVGELELRVGTPEELLGDRWTHREVVQLARGAKLSLVVKL